MLTTIGLAIITFTITNIDDLLILSMYFANPEYKTRNIVLGQYLGMIALISFSLIGLILGTFLADHWISFLGVVPLLLGIKGMIALRKVDDDSDDDAKPTKSNYQYLSVALITIANGGDNIGVYAPLFANLTVQDIIVYGIVFLVLTACWCLLSYYLTNHPKVKSLFEKHGKVILPCFLILLGLLIMKDFWLWIYYSCILAA